MFHLPAEQTLLLSGWLSLASPAHTSSSAFTVVVMGRFGPWARSSAQLFLPILPIASTSATESLPFLSL